MSDRLITYAMLGAAAVITEQRRRERLARELGFTIERVNELLAGEEQAQTLTAEESESIRRVYEKRVETPSRPKQKTQRDQVKTCTVCGRTHIMQTHWCSRGCRRKAVSAIESVTNKYIGKCNDEPTRNQLAEELFDVIGAEYQVVCDEKTSDSVTLEST